MSYQIYDPVLGRVEFAKGEWYGIMLDESFTEEKISRVLPCRKSALVRRAKVEQLRSNNLRRSELGRKLRRIGRGKSQIRDQFVKEIGEGKPVVRQQPRQDCAEEHTDGANVCYSPRFLLLPSAESDDSSSLFNYSDQYTDSSSGEDNSEEIRERRAGSNPHAEDRLVKVNNILKWVIEMKKEISTVEINPKTFDDVMVILGQEREKLFQLKLTELRNLIGSREDLQSASISDFSRPLATKVKEFLLKVREEWHKKIGLCSWKVKKNLRSLRCDYWNRAKGVREKLVQIETEYTTRAKGVREKLVHIEREYTTNHPCFSSTAKFKIVLMEMQSGNDLIEILKRIEKLRKCGEFLWKINTPKNADCLQDAMELGFKQELISRKIRHMIDKLKLSLNYRELAEI